MKKLLAIALLASGLMASIHSSAQMDQEKSKRASLPAKVVQKITSGATISIDYSQPAVKGRTIGKDLEPMDGQVWRTGANEATVFETDKDVTVAGKTLAAGKYGFFTLFNGDQVTIIFNKTWKQWGAFKYSAADDVFRVDTKYSMATPLSEKMTFKISADGIVTLLWGDRKFDFKVK
jgi:hypothetical protein